jgi:hypothetical protein
MFDSKLFKEVLTKYVQCRKSNYNDSFSMDMDEIVENLDKMESYQKQLISMLHHLDFNGIQSQMSYGSIILTKSSKVEGMWQVTTFDQKLIPIGDYGVVSKEEAIYQFFDEVGHGLNVIQIIQQINI